MTDIVTLWLDQTLHLSTNCSTFRCTKGIPQTNF